MQDLRLTISIPYERGIAGTGIVATLSKGDGQGIVGFRTDIDALPISENHKPRISIDP